jgi:hypothetical protein
VEVLRLLLSKYCSKPGMRRLSSAHRGDAGPVCLFRSFLVRDYCSHEAPHVVLHGKVRSFNFKEATVAACCNVVGHIGAVDHEHRTRRLSALMCKFTPYAIVLTCVRQAWAQRLGQRASELRCCDAAQQLDLQEALRPHQCQDTFAEQAPQPGKEAHARQQWPPDTGLATPPAQPCCI